MLLKSLSNKARHDVQRTNKGEAPLPAAPDEPPRRARQRNGNYSPAPRFEPVDPTTMNGTVPEYLITNVVNSQDELPENKRYNAKYMHLTELLKDPCARQVALWDENPKVPIFQQTTGGHRLMWLQGRATEAHIRNQFIKGVKNKGVIGIWKCKCEATENTGQFDTRWPACPRCRTATTNYNELTL